MKKLLRIIIILMLCPIVVLANTTTTNTNVLQTTTTTLQVIEDISLETLAPYKDALQNDNEVVSITTSNIFFYKTDNKDSVSFILAEKEYLSEDTYSSLLAIIETMFDKEVLSYFKANYKNVEHSKSFQGFNIELNPPLQAWEDDLLESFHGKYVRVTINREEVTEALKDIDIVEDDITSIIKSLFTDQTSLTTTKFLGFTLIEVLLFIGIIFLIIYILFGLFLNNFHKVSCGQSSIMAFLPITNIYILAKLAINKIFAFIFILLILISGYLTIFTDISSLIPLNVQLYIYLAYGIIILILWIYGTFKYDRIKAEGGGITLHKLKIKKQDNTNNQI